MAVDFSRYTLAELKDSRAHIDEQAYPDRVVLLDSLIEKKSKEPQLNERSLFQLKEGRYSTVGPRIVGAILDLVVLAFIALIPSVVLAFLSDQFEYLIGLIEQAQFLIYSILFHSVFGQTIGKYIVDIKVVDAVTEGAINYKQAFMRDLVPVLIFLVSNSFMAYLILSSDETGMLDWFVDATFWFFIIFVVWCSLEWITMLMNKKRRALHDYMAGTVVIRTDIQD